MPMPEGTGFCHRCGAQLPEGATFCPKCGTAVTSAAQAVAQGPARIERREKAEKHEKQEKREKNEKGSGSGMLGALVGGLILIWLGVTFFLEQNGYLRADIWWAYFLAGLGVILILQGLVIYSRGRTGLGPMIGGIILAFIGFGTIVARQYNVTEQFWPLLLVALGVFVIVAGVASRRRVPTP